MVLTGKIAGSMPEIHLPQPRSSCQVYELITLKIKVKEKWRVL